MSIEQMNPPPENTEEAVFSSAMQAMVRSTRDMVFIKDVNLRYLAVSDPYVKLIGCESASALIGRTAEEVISHPEMTANIRAAEQEMLSSQKDMVDQIQSVPTENRQPRYISASKYLLKNSSGEIVGILSVLRDVTREYIARQHYEQALQMLFKLPKNIYAAIFIDVDDWRLIGKRGQLVHGCALPAFRTIDELYEFVTSGRIDSGDDFSFSHQTFSQASLQETYRSGQSVIMFNCHRRLTDDIFRWVHNRLQFLIDEKSGHLCAMLSIRDIDEQKRAEHELTVAAQMDRMTMVLNRETAIRRIREVFAISSGQSHGLFILDIDNFKMLNDTYGHQAGDKYLIELATVLKRNFRENDIIGRIGGDEFFILMQNISNPEMTQRRAKELLEDIQFIGTKYPDIPLSASIGISLFPKDGTSVEELYEKADASLYRVKKSGKNQFAMFVSPEAEETSQATQQKGTKEMTLKEFYLSQGGDYQDVIDRLHNEEIAIRFLIRFADDPCFEKLRQAVESGSQKDTFLIVHTFKGTCLNIGLEALAESAKQLTEAVRTEFSPEVPKLFEKVAEDYANTIAAIRTLQSSQNV